MFGFFKHDRASKIKMTDQSEKNGIRSENLSQKKQDLDSQKRHAQLEERLRQNEQIKRIRNEEQQKQYKILEEKDFEKRQSLNERANEALAEQRKEYIAIQESIIEGKKFEIEQNLEKLVRIEKSQGNIPYKTKYCKFLDIDYSNRNNDSCSKYDWSPPSCNACSWRERHTDYKLYYNDDVGE